LPTDNEEESKQRKVLLVFLSAVSGRKGRDSQEIELFDSIESVMVSLSFKVEPLWVDLVMGWMDLFVHG
jgi:hypothetical protein